MTSSASSLDARQMARDALDITAISLVKLPPGMLVAARTGERQIEVLRPVARRGIVVTVSRRSIAVRVINQILIDRPASLAEIFWETP